MSFKKIKLTINFALLLNLPFKAIYLNGFKKDWRKIADIFSPYHNHDKEYMTRGLKVEKPMIEWPKPMNTKIELFTIYKNQLADTTTI